jgi:hypothetical protein
VRLHGTGGKVWPSHETRTPPEPPSTSEKEAVDKEDKAEKTPSTDKDEPSIDKSTPSHDEPNDSTHEKDKHVDEPGQVDKDASHVQSTQVCSGMTCRASLLAALVGVLFVESLLDVDLLEEVQSWKFLLYTWTRMMPSTFRHVIETIRKGKKRTLRKQEEDDEDGVAEEEWDMMTMNWILMKLLS